jgi:hypothetical protein
MVYGELRVDQHGVRFYLENLSDTLNYD